MEASQSWRNRSEEKKSKYYTSPKANNNVKTLDFQKLLTYKDHIQQLSHTKYLEITI